MGVRVSTVTEEGWFGLMCRVLFSFLANVVGGVEGVKVSCIFFILISMWSNGAEFSQVALT